MRPAHAMLALLTLTGCADARGRFQAFEERRGALDGQAGTANVAGATGAGGEPACAPPAPDVVSGRALLAIETSMSPGLAILFLGEITTPAINGKTAVQFDYKALDSLDRKTLVGDSLQVGPYVIGEDGTFEGPTGKSTLPGSANPILRGVAVTSDLTLHGTICGVDTFYCGTVTGESFAPLVGPVTGQFGLTLLGSDGELPERPRLGCGTRALAPALPSAEE